MQPVIITDIATARYRQINAAWFSVFEKNFLI